MRLGGGGGGGGGCTINDSILGGGGAQNTFFYYKFFMTLKYCGGVWGGGGRAHRRPLLRGACACTVLIHLFCLQFTEPHEKFPPSLRNQNFEVDSLCKEITQNCESLV